MIMIGTTSDVLEEHQGAQLSQPVFFPHAGTRQLQS